MYIIQDFAKIINSRLRKWVIYLLSLISLSIFLIFISVFYVTQEEANKAQILLTPSGIKENNANNTDSRGFYFASKRGKYYYFKGCGGDKLSPKNLIYFKTESEAIKAGKILYSKCK